ncbi:hypothetical protein MTR_6g009100 [Medicago truncatula]|uniref:F-box domain-containing protein n=1 Tax=Medicago truncatula TaxID=3880 RepID=G7KJY2_MEDTR|nr:hypothetical protein MTR_6g009100 [Medicago truncatula]
MVAEWSQLPHEFLQLISQKLNRELYLIRSRSFGQFSCQLFRSHPNIDVVMYLIKHDIFLFKPPKHQQNLHQRPWLIRIGPDFDGKTKLLHPLLFDGPLPSLFNYVLNFNKLSVIHLRHM